MFNTRLARTYGARVFVTNTIYYVLVLFVWLSKWCNKTVWGELLLNSRSIISQVDAGPESPTPLPFSSSPDQSKTILTCNNSSSFINASLCRQHSYLAQFYRYIFINFVYVSQGKLYIIVQSIIKSVMQCTHTHRNTSSFIIKSCRADLSTTYSCVERIDAVTLLRVSILQLTAACTRA